ncbi:type II secretion system protein [Sutcliffiella horikoshii]|uniref:type II secretion system protein n=1 Tax=Sutcliffiella horikoshii TaxID=79883 RepID=UPI003CE889FE
MLQKCRKMLRNEKGLTLIELLAVVVILGIIAAIAVPSIGNIIEKSREDAHIANGQQLMNAAKLALLNEEVTPTSGQIQIADLSEYIDKIDTDDYASAYVTVAEGDSIEGATLVTKDDPAKTISVDEKGVGTVTVAGEVEEEDE